MSVGKKCVVFVLIVMMSALIVLYTYFRHSVSMNGAITLDNSFMHNYNNITHEISFPNPIFFHNLAKYYDWMDKIQTHLDDAAKTREGVIGNIAWFPSQVYYYARSASLDWISNICEIGYGAGHSTILYLSINPRAHIYSFDLFPDNEDNQIHTPGETLVFQQAFQAVTLKAIDDNRELASRFHKIIGNSNSSIPKFIKKNSHFKCDLLSIDGSHNPPQPFFDMFHSQPLAHQHTIVLLDDMQSRPVKAELEKAIQLGFLEHYECLKPEVHVDLHFSSAKIYDKEFCAVRYRNFNEKST